MYESNGPDVKVRGTANHVAEKYLQLARDAQSSGDPVAAEAYYQHAEHYFRLIAAVQEQFRQTQPFGSEGQGNYESDEDEIEPGMGGEPFAPREQQQPYQQQQREQQPYQGREQREQQPYQQREQRFDRNRDRDNRGDRGDRNGNDRNAGDRSGGDRGDRPERGDRDGNFQPRQQPQAQPQPQSSEPDEAPDVDRLPAFVTGGVTTPAPAANNGHTGGQNGFEGGADRFPLHRRRRRRGPRDSAAPAGETTEAAGTAD